MTADALSLFDELDPHPVAHARTTDPETSHAAAASITSEKLRDSQRAVLHMLQMRGGTGTDPQILAEYRKRGVNHIVPQSDSGIRTRRAELVAKGLVEDSGERVTLPSGRKSIVWRAV